MNCFPWRRSTVGLLISLTLIGALFRFINLAQPSTLTGDEVYFANFGRNYLTQTPFFDVHPPLGKLIIAAGIRLFGFNPFGWRFASALIGTLLIPAVYWFGWSLSRRRVVAFGLATIVSIDGLFLVESRLAAINLGYVLWLMLAYAGFFQFTRSSRYQVAWLTVSGGALGLAISSKWVALAAWPALIILVLASGFLGLSEQTWSQKKRWWLAGVFYGLLPVSIYLLVWFIHFARLGLPFDWLTAQLKIFIYHSSITEIHRYESPWWSWLFLWKPFPYLIDFQPAAVRILTGLGNPLIWWPALGLGIAAIFQNIRRSYQASTLLMLLLFHWLPFIFIKRSMFLYHSIPAFLMMSALALLFVSSLSPIKRSVILAIWLIAALAGLIFFIPVYTGAAIAPEAVDSYRWLPSWFH